MSGSTRRFLPLLAMLLISAACSPTHEALTPADGGDLAIVQLETRDAVPEAWGPLVSVMATYDDRYYQLWFQDEEGTIRIVYFDQDLFRLLVPVRVIPRT
ncbi:hypothetical protein ACFL3S_08975 [Gemmatimonadota bacterium]